MGRSVAGGRISTPMTRKLESMGRSLRPRLPEIPVTITDGGASAIYFFPGGGLCAAGDSPGPRRLGGAGVPKYDSSNVVLTEFWNASNELFIFSPCNVREISS